MKITINMQNILPRIGILARTVLMAFAIAVTGIAHAAPVAFNFFGTTADGGPIGVTQLTGSVTYDTASFTNDILIGSVSAGGYTWTYSPQPPNISNLQSIYVYNNVGSPMFDEVDFFIGITGPNLTYNAATWRPSYMVLAFGNDPSVLQSSAIPSDPNLFNSFSTRYANPQFELLDAQGAGTGQYSGLMFTPIMVGSPVPVPTAAWLLSSGLLGLIGVARRKAA